LLLAEIHGKSLEAARDNEDYLTSAVFGHLRYVPPGPFWDDLFRRAKGLSGTDGCERSLGLLLAATPFAGYSDLTVHFWSKHGAHGEPDLILVFNGPAPLVVLVEAKLWSEKSGTGERDQLVRYLRILEGLNAIDVHVPAQASRYLVYLTPRDSQRELDDSATHLDNPIRDRPRLFRLQWQDVLEAAEATSPHSPEPARTILADTACFLRALGLVHFRGMSCLDKLPALGNGFGAFYTAAPTGFQGLGHLPDLDLVKVCKGAWA
jgi:hypothetical protein